MLHGGTSFLHWVFAAAILVFYNASVVRTSSARGISSWSLRVGIGSDENGQKGDDNITDLSVLEHMTSDESTDVGAIGGEYAISYQSPHGNEVSAKVQCNSDHITITLEFQYPFSGFVYPYERFRECLLRVGHGEAAIRLQMGPGLCGRFSNSSERFLWQYRDSVIEHRLVIQYERELVTDGDINLVTRCEMPDTYNKTVPFHLREQELGPGAIHSAHPEVVASMEFQMGQGPESPQVDTWTVLVSQPLTLVIRVYHARFWFDANVISCVALEAAGESPDQFSWQHSKMPVIDHGCSARKRVFSNVFKKKVQDQKQLTVLQWIYFKAFRLPATGKITFGCEIQVCFRDCHSTDICSEDYNPHEETERQRRNVKEARMSKKSTERILLSRTIEVAFLSSEPPLSVHTGQMQAPKCLPDLVCYWSVITLAVTLVTILIIGACRHYRAIAKQETETSFHFKY